MQTIKDMMRWAQISLIAALCLTMMALLSPLAAHAAEAVDTSKDDCTLSIQHSYDGSPLPGAAFRIYRVASLSESPEITVVAPFNEYNAIPAKGMNQDEWKDYAQTLAGYISRDGIQPYKGMTVATDSTGTATFTGLKTGIYLVIGTDVCKGDCTYVVSPYMISIPTLNSDKEKTDYNTWTYDVISKTKVTDYPTPAPDLTIDLTITKIWNDVGHEDRRPTTVTIDLMCDDQVYDTVELSAANGWTNEWKSLNPKHSWTVAEREVSGYTVKVIKGDNAFVVENTFNASDEPGAEPGGGDDPGDEPSEDGGGDGGKLPQTGMLWWPVVALFVAGLGLVLIGVIRRRRA